MHPSRATARRFFFTLKRYVIYVKLWKRWLRFGIFHALSLNYDVCRFLLPAWWHWVTKYLFQGKKRYTRERCSIWHLVSLKVFLNRFGTGVKSEDPCIYETLQVIISSSLHSQKKLLNSSIFCLFDRETPPKTNYPASFFCDAIDFYTRCSNFPMLWRTSTNWSAICCSSTWSSAPSFSAMN